ncbi:MAG: DNA-formamidopyrimidine glycosylase family protein [Nocardioides sp.]
MPEGDTVWRAARRLDRALTGEVLTGSDFRVPQHATADLTGSTVTGTVSRGKHLLTRFAPVDAPGVTLHTHLKMEGVWHVHPRGTRWRRLAHEARVVLTTAGWEAVGFALGVVSLLRTADEDEAVGHLGPDLLGPDWDEDEAVHRLATDRTRTIGEALLDQTNLAGVGSVYRSELCFVAGLHPRTPVGEVRDLRRVVRRAKQMLELNKSRTERVTTGNARGGRLWIYGRRGACPRCGTTVLHEEFGPEGQERVSYWCPSCQPAPS